MKLWNVKRNAKCQEKKCVEKVELLQFKLLATQSAFACSKLTIETLDEGVKYVQS